MLNSLSVNQARSNAAMNLDERIFVDLRFKAITKVATTMCFSDCDTIDREIALESRFFRFVETRE